MLCLNFPNYVFPCMRRCRKFVGAGQASQDIGDLKTCPPDTQSTSAVTTRDPDRIFTLQRRAELLESLANTLLEFYHCNGPAYLLPVIGLLYEAFKEILFIACTTRIPRAMTHLGYVSLEEYRLSHNLEALKRSIHYFQFARKQLLPSSSQYRTTAAGLAYALLYRYSAYNSNHDWLAAMKTLETIPEQIHIRTSDANFIISQAWFLTVTVFVKTTGTSIMEAPLTLEYLEGIMSRLDSFLSSLLPTSRYVLALWARSALSIALCRRTKQLQYLHDGIRSIESALHLCSRDALVMHAQLSERLASLNHYVYLYQGDSRDRNHLNTAICIMENIRGSDLLECNVYARSNTLFSWAAYSMDQAVKREDMDGMEDILNTLREAESICPESHVTKQLVLSRLAYALGLYFDQSGRVSVLDEVIALGSKLNTDCKTQAPFLVSNIAEGMIARAETVDSVAARRFLDHAIDLCQRRRNALDSAWVDGTERVILELHIIKASQMQLESQVEDRTLLRINVTNMLEMARRGLEIIIEQSTRTSLVIALTEALIFHARSSGDGSVLAEAKETLEQELSSEALTSSVYRADLLAAQADLLVVESEIRHNEDPEALNEAWKLYHHAAVATAGRGKERFKSCLRWAAHAAERGYASEAFKAYSCAIGILPQLVFLGEDVLGRIAALRQVNGLAASSAAIAISINDIPSAIHFLEQTRGIIWLQSLHPRIAELELLPSTVRTRYVKSMDELNQADRLQWTSRRRAAEEMDSVVKEIRTIPNFERFRLPPLLEEIDGKLRLLNGSAVVIIPSALYCDVVVLGFNKGSRHLRLTTLNRDRVQQLARTFIEVCGSNRAAQREGLSDQRGVKRIDLSNQASGTDVLQELWLSLVHPIFKSMKLLDRTDGNAERQRLWWCPIGAFSSLPLHVAGIYDDEHATPPEHVGKYVVSSYALTLSTLYRMMTETLAGNHSRTLDTTLPRLLLVAQPAAGDLPALPNTQLEAACVKSVVPLESLIDLPDEAGVSVEMVLKQVTNAHILHLACHGHQAQDNPLESGFDLRDGRLTLGQLMRVNIPNARIAYLSACESAGMDASRPDEGLNLAGAMILAGFTSVIATMWTMDDIDGPFMAGRIYKRIFRNKRLDINEVPYALEDAVRELRESGVPAARWATYVHFGV